MQVYRFHIMCNVCNHMLHFHRMAGDQISFALAHLVVLQLLGQEGP